MLKFSLILLLFLSPSHGQDSKNSYWKITDELVKTIDVLYDNLARSVEDADDPQKRAFSIIVTGILQFVATSGNRTASMMDLSRPADVIAASTRSRTDVIRSVVDPAITVVKTACPPSATDLECSNDMIKIEVEMTRQCGAFSEHIRFRKASEKLVADVDWQGFLTEALEVSEKGDDEEALRYLTAVETGRKHKGLLPKFKEWFLSFAIGNFVCNLPPQSEALQSVLGHTLNLLKVK